MFTFFKTNTKQKQDLTLEAQTDFWQILQCDPKHMSPVSDEKGSFITYASSNNLKLKPDEI